MSKNTERLAFRLSVSDREAMRVVAEAMNNAKPGTAPWARVTMSDALRASLKVAARVALADPTAVSAAFSQDR